MVKRPLNPWICNSFIDSCAFDPKYSPEDEAANQIFELHRNEQLGIQIAHSTQKEINHPNTPSWVKTEALSAIYTIEVSLTSNEQALQARIHSILTGDGKPENYAADAKHVYEAQKYGSYFITTDTRILDKATEQLGVCNIDILKPSQFLAIVQANKKGDS